MAGVVVAEDVKRATGPPTWRTWIEPWFLSYAFLGISVAGLAPILLPLSVGRSGSVSDIGLVMGAFNLGGLSAPLWGGVADRYSVHRLLLMMGLLGTAVALAAFPFASSIELRLILGLVQGTGAACAATVANLFIVEMHPRSEWDERIGWLQTFYGAGQVFGLLLAGGTSGQESHAGFFIGAGTMFVACVPALFMRGKPHAVPVKRPVLLYPSRHVELTAGSPQSFYHRVDRKAVEHLLRSFVSPFGVFLVAWFTSFVGVAAFFSLYPVLMEVVYGVDPSISSIGFAAAATAGLFFYAPAGKWSRKYGSLRVFRAALMTRVLAFLVLFIIGALRFLVGGSLALIGFAFVVVAWSLLSVTGTEITAQYSEGHEGEGLGLFNACTAVAGVLGAVIGGWSAESWGCGFVSVLGIGGATVGLLMSGIISTPATRRIEKER